MSTEITLKNFVVWEIFQNFAYGNTAFLAHHSHSAYLIRCLEKSKVSIG